MRSPRLECLGTGAPHETAQRAAAAPRAPESRSAGRRPRVRITPTPNERWLRFTRWTVIAPATGAGATQVERDFEKDVGLNIVTLLHDSCSGCRKLGG
jgi:hypothetical protein